MSARTPFVPSATASARPASKPPAIPSEIPAAMPLNLQNLMKGSKKSGKNSNRRESAHDVARPASAFGLPKRLSTSTPIVAPRPVLPAQSMSPLIDSAEPKDAPFASPDRRITARIKRTRNDFEEDPDSFQYDMPYKRCKHDEQVAARTPTNNNFSSPLGPSHHSNYEPSPHGFPSHYEEHDQEIVQPQSQSQSQPEPTGSGALNKLLGRDADLFVEQHLDIYDALIAKYKNCSMDEWVAGADSIMGKYGKIMDFVKDHMTTKMKLFATFDRHVDAHNVVLGEREKVLVGVKQRLVNESGNILGPK